MRYNGQFCIQLELYLIVPLCTNLNNAEPWKKINQRVRSNVFSPCLVYSLLWGEEEKQSVLKKHLKFLSFYWCVLLLFLDFFLLLFISIFCLFLLLYNSRTVSIQYLFFNGGIFFPNYWLTECFVYHLHYPRGNMTVIWVKIHLWNSLLESALCSSYVKELLTKQHYLKKLRRKFVKKFRMCWILLCCLL